MNDSVLAQVAALPEKSTADLKQLWRDLYDREPPPYNKPFLVKRLAYRIQELAYGGLSARAEAKLKALVEEEDRRLKGKLPVRKGDRPITGTRLIREWQGVEHTRHGARRRLRVPGPAVQVAVGDCPRHHRHALERAPLFWGFAITGAASESTRPQGPLRHLHAQVLGRGPGDGVQLARRAARGGAGLHPEPEAARAGSWSATATTTAASPAAAWSARRCSGCCATSRAAPSTSSSSTRSTGCPARSPTSQGLSKYLTSITFRS